MTQFKIFMTGFIVLLFGLFSLAVEAETKVTTQLVEGNKFRDYQLTGYSRSKSLEVLQTSFNKLFTQLAEKKQEEGKLSDNTSIEIKITDVDLEGFYHLAVGPQNQEMRIVDSNTPYRMNFEYTIKDATGKVLKQGEHKISELANSRSSDRLHQRRGYVSYYKRPLKKWFDATFN